MNIGLLLTYQEGDVLEEMLRVNAASVDAIFALDGSSDGSERILAACPKVEAVLRDEEVAPDGRVRDHHRQALLDRARQRYGADHWYTLMHGDEIFHDDANAVVEAAERAGAHRVNWAAMQFFLHEDDTLDPTLPVQERVRWYSPFWVELRQFRDRPGAAYRSGEHGRVVPRGIGWRPYGRMPILKHYPFRSEAQARARIEAAQARGFSGTEVEGSVRRRRYSARYRLARHFEGDFGELESTRQGGLLRMMWRWKRWTR
ncbi:MAG: hypothetical protein U5K81_11055 [Trueperaceae bacterium]|nr:hypothetical protein [Trueperaceae bacterium]